MKMEAIRSSETSGATQRTTQCHIPEDDTLHLHRCENLKSYILKSYYTCNVYRHMLQTVMFSTIYRSKDRAVHLRVCKQCTYLDNGRLYKAVLTDRHLSQNVLGVPHMSLANSPFSRNLPTTLDQDLMYIFQYSLSSQQTITLHQSFIKYQCT
jgi:hypothetical protein